MSTPSENRQPPLRVLLVEDSSADAHLFLDMLEAGDDTRAGVPGLQTMLLDRLELALDCRRPLRTPVALLVLDLDRFKAINDAHGHAAGDAVLLTVGRALRYALRTEDTVARFGGDDFAALREDVPDARLVAVVATRVLEGVRGIRCEEQVASVGPGIELSHPAVPPEQLLASADEAMFAAKRGGRDRCVLRAPVAGAL